MPQHTSIRDEVDGAAGYTLRLSLSSGELAQLKSFIEDQWHEHLQRVAPDSADRFAELGISRYHELSHLVDHGSIWPKQHRIFPALVVAEIREMSLCRTLREGWGEFAISDEDAIGREEIYWRLVRPHQPADVGPLHADNWFWVLSDWKVPPGKRRIKVWIAIETEPGRNGLRVVPGSHLREWRYHGVDRNGMVKPQIDEDERQLNPLLVPMNPGDVIVFHDNLLHGGSLNSGMRTRISAEFTAFVDI